MSLAHELERLHELRQRGVLSEAEFQSAKARVLAREGCSRSAGGADFFERIESWVTQENSWGALIHLSQFCGYLVPLGGFIVPILLWQMRNKESALIDQNGRVVMNWIISHLLWWIIAVILSFVLIGLPILWFLGIVTVVFPMVGAFQALRGKAWVYPGSIPFLKVR